MIHQLFPSNLKRTLCLIHRQVRERNLQFARPGPTLTGPEHWLVSQVIKTTSSSANKIHNLRLGARKIESIVLHPGEHFSFWRILGNPSLRNGYKPGRNIVQGVLQEGIGGGLCQLSGILYYTALKVGFPIVERFNHTLDIYQEEDRFAPLGSDATVVYGHKDLQFRNHLEQPVQFLLNIKPNQISCGIRTQSPVVTQDPVFVRQDQGRTREVVTWVGGSIVARSRYKVNYNAT